MAGHIVTFIVRMKIWKDNSGQDMLEYACFIAAICLMYAAISPTILTSVSTVFSKIADSAASAASTS
jgi:Flp pilus assembly pilin Flp